MFDLEILARLIPSLIEITIITYMLNVYLSKDGKHTYVTYFNSVIILTASFLYMQSLGGLIPITACLVNGLLINKDKIKRLIRFILTMCGISLITQSTVFMIYSAMTTYDSVSVVFPASIAILIEFMFFKSVFINKGENNMTILWWVGKKEKRSHKQYKEAKKSKK